MRRSLYDFQPFPSLLFPQLDIIKLVPLPPPSFPPPTASATTRSFTFNWEINLARGIVTRNIYKGVAPGLIRVSISRALDSSLLRPIFPDFFNLAPRGGGGCVYGRSVSRPFARIPINNSTYDEKLASYT